MFIIQIGRVTPTKSWGEIPLKQTVDWIRCRYWLPNESPCETLSLVDTFSPSKSACYLCIPSFYCLHEVFDAQVVWLSKFRNYRPIAIRKRHGKSLFSQHVFRAFGVCPWRSMKNFPAGRTQSSGLVNSAVKLHFSWVFYWFRLHPRLWCSKLVRWFSQKLYSILNILINC